VTRLLTAATVLLPAAVAPLVSAGAAGSSRLAEPRPRETAVALATGNPLSLTHGLYVDPQLPAARWVAAHPADKRAAAIRTSIGRQPMAHWFTGTSDADLGQAVTKYTRAAQTAGKLPVLVAYNLPGRDACGAESAGGAASAAAYRKWITTFATAIGTRPAVVILEPDALGDFSCMTTAPTSFLHQLCSTQRTAHGRTSSRSAGRDCPHTSHTP